MQSLHNAKIDMSIQYECCAIVLQIIGISPIYLHRIVTEGYYLNYKEHAIPTIQQFKLKLLVHANKKK